MRLTTAFLILPATCERRVKRSRDFRGSEAADLHLDELRGPAPQGGLKRLVGGRLRRVDPSRAFEEPPRGTGVRGGDAELGDILSGAFRRPRDEARKDADGSRGFAHQLLADQAGGKGIRPTRHTPLVP